MELLEDLAGHLGRNADPGLSSGLVYRVRETLTRLCDWTQWEPGTWGALPEDLDIRAFLRAEILRSPDGSASAETRADDLAGLVWVLLGRSRAPGAAAGYTAEVGVDALLLARFLADPVHEEAD